MTLRLNAYLNASLHDSSELNQLSQKAEQILALQNFYIQTAPLSLSRASHVMFLADYILVIVTYNGAIAAKLRQIAPTLTRAFQDSGYEVTAIQVKVQVTQTVLTKPPSRLLISSKSKQQISELSDKLAPSPLRNALQRLIEKKQRQ